jgi:hypothetical protein
MWKVSPRRHEEHEGHEEKQKLDNRPMSLGYLSGQWMHKFITDVTTPKEK